MRMFAEVSGSLAWTDEYRGLANILALYKCMSLHDAISIISTFFLSKFVPPPRGGAKMLDCFGSLITAIADKADTMCCAAFFVSNIQFTITVKYYTASCIDVTLDGCR